MDAVRYAETMWSMLREVQRWVGFWGPIVPIPSPLAPLAIAGALLAVVITTGMALAAVGVLLTSLLVLHLLLTQVFGLDLEVRLP